jgi:hypothetical protein
MNSKSKNGNALSRGQNTFYNQMMSIKQRMEELKVKVNG